jgi:hypothetical protein
VKTPNFKDAQVNTETIARMIFGGVESSASKDAQVNTETIAETTNTKEMWCCRCVVA